MKSAASRIIFLSLLHLALFGAGCRTAMPVSGEFFKYKELASAREIGMMSAATFLQGNTVLINPTLREDLQKLADEISAVADCHVQSRVHIVNSPLINVLAFPSDDLVVFTGLLDVVENRDELAFAFGHEIAHLCLGHGLDQMKETLYRQKVGGQVGSIIGSIVATTVSTAVSSGLAAIPIGKYQPLLETGITEPVGMIAARMVAGAPEQLVLYLVTCSMHGYSQQQESEADRVGIQYMEQAGYHAEAADSILQKLSEERQRAHL